MRNYLMQWGRFFGIPADDEGPDDMLDHLKAALFGSSVMIPISNGKLALGTWQGVYLCEHRNHGGSRSLVLTAWGEEREIREKA